MVAGNYYIECTLYPFFLPWAEGRFPILYTLNRKPNGFSECRRFHPAPIQSNRPCPRTLSFQLWATSSHVECVPAPRIHL